MNMRVRSHLGKGQIYEFIAFSPQTVTIPSHATPRLLHVLRLGWTGHSLVGIQSDNGAHKVWDERGCV